MLAVSVIHTANEEAYEEASSRGGPTISHTTISEKGQPQQSGWTDWAVWQLPGGPVGLASRWAATSNVEVGQTTYPIKRGRVGTEGREGSEGQSHKR